MKEKWVENNFYSMKLPPACTTASILDRNHCRPSLRSPCHGCPSPNWLFKPGSQKCCGGLVICNSVTSFTNRPGSYSLASWETRITPPRTPEYCPKTSPGSACYCGQVPCLAGRRNCIPQLPHPSRATLLHPRPCGNPWCIHLTSWGRCGGGMILPSLEMTQAPWQWWGTLSTSQSALQSDSNKTICNSSC